MSFRIHAAGTDGFRYTRDNNPDEDVFQAAEVIATLLSLEPSVEGAVGIAADQVTPSVGAADIVRVGANIEFIHNLRGAVDMLATHSGATRNGWISVAPRQTNLLFPDTTDFTRFEFYQDDTSPGSEFIRQILPVLRTTDFNNYGVFRALGNALWRYEAHIDRAGSPMILIQLSK